MKVFAILSLFAHAGGVSISGKIRNLFRIVWPWHNILPICKQYGAKQCYKNWYRESCPLTCKDWVGRGSPDWDGKTKTCNENFKNPLPCNASNWCYWEDTKCVAYYKGDESDGWIPTFELESKGLGWEKCNGSLFEYYTDKSQQECEGECIKRKDCHFYSNSTHGSCVLFKEKKIDGVTEAIYWLGCYRKPQGVGRPSDDCDESIEGNGTDYRGCQNKTINGKDCQKWTDQEPHEHNNKPESRPDKGLLDGEHNFCRNPDGVDSIWCYTTNPDVRWEPCRPIAV